MFNPVAPYRYLLPNLYLSVADIANPGWFACGGIFPYMEWASFVSCLTFSTLAYTSRLMLGGAIPDSKYNSSTFVGLRHLGMHY